jgi:signal transduction histidine kinase/CheY-like chemotaxis protein
MKMGKAEKNENPESRVLVFMPTGRDAPLVCRTLEEAGIFAVECRDAADLEENINAGAGAVLLAEEGLGDGALDRFAETFRQQPVWSDLPVILFASNPNNSERLLKLVGTCFNTTIVERPIRIAMLVSAVRAALRARTRQYQARDLLNQLEEADRQKDLFLATLSHELRTPLNSMLGWIKMLREKSGNSPELEHGLGVIERSTKAQIKVISDILFVSRAITGKLELEMEEIDLLTVVRAAMDIMRPSSEAKFIELEFSHDAGYQIRGDADRLQQVFLNLISNAIKFTPPDGKISVRLKGKGPNVEIEIADTGQGIKKEFLPYVFERFRQADSSYAREAGGLGLGLAIVHHLVELHGGEIAVKSDGIGCGATFTVSLPVLSAARTKGSPNGPEPEKSRSLPDRSPGEIHVLLVEDDADSREMLEVFFTQVKMKVTAVDSAAKALEAVKKLRPDVLVSDVGLPGEDGYELIRQIRELAPESGGAIPALALTGYASLQDRARAIEAGYQEHMAKPVDIDRLVELVKNLLAGKSVNGAKPEEL